MLSTIITVCALALGVGAALGLAFGLFILLPLVVYTVPYLFWVCGQKEVGKHLDLFQGLTRKNSLFQLQNVRNATKLYKAWIRHTEPTF
ncbi:MAG: hypothetical protein VB085_13505, partial [Peptococcaceae bacterium]|nr:hypothetical protein [Peptococcaceae bacterium]